MRRRQHRGRRLLRRELRLRSARRALRRRRDLLARRHLRRRRPLRRLERSRSALRSAGCRRRGAQASERCEASPLVALGARHGRRSTGPRQSDERRRAHALRVRRYAGRRLDRARGPCAGRLRLVRARRRRLSLQEEGWRARRSHLAAAQARRRRQSEAQGESQRPAAVSRGSRFRLGVGGQRAAPIERRWLLRQRVLLSLQEGRHARISPTAATEAAV